MPDVRDINRALGFLVLAGIGARAGWEENSRRPSEKKKRKENETKKEEDDIIKII